LRDQHERTSSLIDLRRSQFRDCTGRELTDDNVWVRERLRGLASLDGVIDRLADKARVGGSSVAGAGTAKRLPLLQVQTRGTHESVLRKADHPPRDQA